MSNLDKEIFKNHEDYWLVADNIKGIYMSDGSLLTLLDFERVLDEADLYAFKNWQLGELVQGPVIGRYTVKCTFMWPYKLMPDPRGAKRLASIGCNTAFAKSQIKVPIEVTNYDDFVQGTKYPKMQEKKVWFVEIEVPKDLMNEVKEGSIDLADQTIDLKELDDAYDNDLDKENTQQEQPQDEAMMASAAPQASAPPQGVL